MPEEEEAEESPFEWGPVANERFREVNSQFDKALRSEAELLASLDSSRAVTDANVNEAAKGVMRGSRISMRRRVFCIILEFFGGGLCGWGFSVLTAPSPPTGQKLDIPRVVGGVIIGAGLLLFIAGKAEENKK